MNPRRVRPAAPVEDVRFAVGIARFSEAHLTCETTLAGNGHEALQLVRLLLEPAGEVWGDGHSILAARPRHPAFNQSANDEAVPIMDATSLRNGKRAVQLRRWRRQAAQMP